VVSSCDATITLESGSGHANRCANTAFTAEFQQQRRSLLRAGLSAESIRAELERLSLGRLRIASKGLRRESDGSLSPVNSEEQTTKGMFLIGAAAVLKSEAISIRTLHEEVSSGSSRMLDYSALAPCRQSPSPEVYSPSPSDIAVIGMSCIVPGSDNPEQFWSNLLEQTVFIREIPKDRFDSVLYFDRDKNAKDRSYSKWGGFIDDVLFDPLFFGIPPNSLQAISPVQLLTLEGVRRALADAGLDRLEFDRENTEVIIANSDGGGFLEDLLTTRVILPLVLGPVPKDVDSLLPEWTGESFIGLLNNVAAGRVANRFDFGGANFTVDAACAASLAAIDIAVKDLETRRCNLAIAGGTDCANSPMSFIAFSKTQALSPDGRVRAFDKKANGIVISEGAGFVVLKRLADAERDGDRIYGVIKSIAASSDGKELGLTAPRSEGQQRALIRAYRKAGFGADTIEYYEAHGTGTALGDRTEIETITTHLKRAGTRAGGCVIGSHKTLIGHTKTAAGVLGLIKGLMALRHRTLPPHAGVDQPLEALTEPRTPIALVDTPRPWWARTAVPRRCGISGFGFGGTNIHAVLEEYHGDVHPAAPGGNNWPSELLLFRAEDRAELLKVIGTARDQIGEFPTLGGLAWKAYDQWKAVTRPGPACSVVATSKEDAKQKLGQLREALEANQKLPFGTFVSLESDPLRREKVALLFPGQGSQYLGMLRDTAVYFDEFRAALERADKQLSPQLEEPLSSLVYPKQAFAAEARARQTENLLVSHHAQPALAAASAGLFHVLQSLGFKFDMVAGHSFGELCAIFAAGGIDESELVGFAAARGQAMNDADCHGGMAVVAAPWEVVRPLSDEMGLVIASINAPGQVVISGERTIVQRAIGEFKTKGWAAKWLLVRGAFHSPSMQAAVESLQKAIEQLSPKPLAKPVYSNETGDVFPAPPAAIKGKIGALLTSPVLFSEMIERMYADGARVFVEAGPGHVLSGLVSKCLEGRPVQTISFDDGTGRLGTFLSGVGALACLGLVNTLEGLWKDRRGPFGRTAATKPSGTSATNSWSFNGMFVRSTRQPYYGRRPLLDSKTSIMKREQPSSNSADSLEAKETLGGPVAAYEAYQRTMQQFLLTQESVMATLLGGSPSALRSPPDAVGQNMAGLPALVDFIPPRSAVKGEPVAAGNGSSLEVPSDISDASEAKKASVTAEGSGRLELKPTRSQLEELLISTVSSATGYPQEMLGLDRDIEGELGIDSIKRLEILSQVVGVLPKEAAAQIVNEMDSLAPEKTLRGIVERISRIVERDGEGIKQGELSASRPASPGQSVDGPATESVENSSGASACPRYVMRPVQEMGEQRMTRLRGTFLVIPDEAGLADLVIKRVKEAGGVPVPVAAERLLQNAEDVLAEIKQGHERIGGILYLSGYQPDWQLPQSLQAWHSGTNLVKALFELLRATALTQDLQEFQLLAVSAMGGFFGRNGGLGQGNPIAAANLGLLNTVDLEFAGVAPKMLDLDPSLPVEQLSNIVMQELVSAGRRLEVGFPNGVRTVFDVVRKEVGSPGGMSSIPDDAVVLAIGGGRGITAQVLTKLAGSRTRVIVAGRSVLQVEPSETRELLTKEMLLEHFRSKQREGLSPQASEEVAHQVSRILENRERVQLLETLKSRQTQVEYVALDMRDETAVSGFLARVYERYGRIDAVLHGAGVVADRPLPKKTRASFDEVFDTKADSTYLLVRYLQPETLKLLVLFSSTAGRFGNPGQADYAAANELLNRLAWYLHHRWPHCQVIAFNWGPWEGNGMVSQTLGRQFIERGIVPIAPAAGCEFVRRELAMGRTSEVEVIAGKGPWDGALELPWIDALQTVKVLSSAVAAGTLFE
jgi:acyl transferase domain-containing protein/NAD(P)-dependent dehydrogenase (short-subunit alcohol dehydrogenase family)